MGLRQLALKNSYDSDEDDVLNEFYIPALSQSTSYLRLAGFFSSSALAIAARGMSQFIKNGGTMKLVIGAKLSKQDIEAIQEGTVDQNQVLTDFMMKDLEAVETEFIRDHVRALALMIANKKLDIKVVIPISIKPEDMAEFEGIYHMKVGLLSDGNDVISFSGSINESRMGWLKSIEEFKVFCNWSPEQDRYVQKDKEKFDKYWNGLAKRAIIVDVPTAVKTKLLSIAPSNIDELQLERYYPAPKISLWKNQTDAIQAWIKHDFRGIFAMATGSGKTLTALSASSLAESRVVTIILVPTLPLLDQWAKREIPKFDPNAIIVTCGGTNPEWKTLLPLKLVGFRRSKEGEHSKRLYVVSTMQSASGPVFLTAFKGFEPDKIQIICDEVHHIGAPKFQKCLTLPSERRLGLSATPERTWDPLGTKAITDYFGSTIYQYDIQDAIKDKRLCHYKYYPFFAFLDFQEFLEFLDITEKINKEIAKLESGGKKEGVPNKTKYLDRLLEERAKIKKKAKDKVRAFRLALQTTDKRPLMIFCEDTEQLTEIQAVVKSLDVGYLKYTSEMKPWEREKALDIFRRKESDLILAIRCLDEGLDVPECEGCIIVASSSSEREFVQRRGRILRGCMKDKVAQLNDIIVLPSQIIEDEQSQKAATILVRQELERVRQLTKASDNEWECRNIIREELKKMGLESLADI